MSNFLFICFAVIFINKLVFEYLVIPKICLTFAKGIIAYYYKVKDRQIEI